MFPNLRAEMARYGIRAGDIAEALETNTDTISNKMLGRTDFRRKEIFVIRDTFFPGLTLEYLFNTSEVS